MNAKNASARGVADKKARAFEPGGAAPVGGGCGGRQHANTQLPVFHRRQLTSTHGCLTIACLLGLDSTTMAPAPSSLILGLIDVNSLRYTVLSMTGMA